MGFGSKIKRAFGFAPDEDNDFDDILNPYRCKRYH